MADLPKTMKAIKVVDVGNAQIQDVPLPQLRDDYVLVKVHAVALNPTDWYARHNRESKAYSKTYTPSPLQEARPRPLPRGARQRLHRRL